MDDLAPAFRVISLNLITMLLSLSVHEYCHARIADWLGDDTPRRQGRLTLSPMAHYDVFGTFLVPIFAALFSPFALIGWARPVETVPSNYTRRITMRRGMTLVAAAGPASNLVLALFSSLLLGIVLAQYPDAGTRADLAGASAQFLLTMLWVNVGLCIFNLIPLPPLDGSRLLPPSLDEFQTRVAPFSFLIILVILNVPILSNAFLLPVTHVASTLLQLSAALSSGIS